MKTSFSQHGVPRTFATMNFSRWLTDNGANYSLKRTNQSLRD